jgi:hypothetical protein
LGGAFNTATVLRVFSETAKGADAHRQSARKRVELLGGAFNTATVLRVFSETAKGADAPRQSARKRVVF